MRVTVKSGTLEQMLSEKREIELREFIAECKEGEESTTLPDDPKELIAMTLAANYLSAGFADDGEADKIAARVLEVLETRGFKIVRFTEKQRQPLSIEEN